jgi:polar amino acid transport system substrate-binding protein
MKSVAVLLSTLCILVSLSAGANDLDAVLKSKKFALPLIQLILQWNLKPMTEKVIGLDVDLARALAKNLKVEAEFIVMPWDGILAGLQSNRYDIIMSS